MKFIKGFYIDAKTGISASLAPTACGPKLPHDNIQIDAVDRRHTPALIIGRIVRSAALDEALTEITTQEHQALLDDYNAWRADVDARNAELEKEARINQIEEQLVKIDERTVRPLRAKLTGFGTDEDDAHLLELETEARQLRNELAELTP